MRNCNKSVPQEASAGKAEGRGTLAREIELKFDVEPGGAEAVRTSPVLAATRGRVTRYESVYYDTKDGALRRLGFSLRVRRAGRRYVQTIKRRGRHAAGLFVRQEWESEVAGFALDRITLAAGPLRRWLADIAPDALIEMARVRFRRTAWQIAFQESRVEVVLDEGTVLHGRRRAPFSELELELIAGTPSALFALAEKIATAAPLHLGILSKGERGYALADGTLGRAAKADRVPLRPPLTEAEAFHAIAQVCLRHFRLNEIVLLAAHDADALHQARVAIRRLRSALSLFRIALRGDDYQQLREELRWFAGQLGEARNLDVLIARGGQDETLVAALLPLRQRAYDKAVAALRSARARRLMIRLSFWLELGHWRTRKRAAHDVSTLATDQLDRQWRRIARRGDDLTALDAEGRHTLRIAVKKLRYAAEFLTPLHAAKAIAPRRDRFLSALKVLQERLGDLNDAWTAEAMAARLPAALRTAVARIHSAKDRQRALSEAERAFRRAASAAGYWRTDRPAPRSSASCPD